jgi:hypothetical protein
MRRERKDEQREERFLARQARLRERRQRKISLPVARQPDGGDSSTAKGSNGGMNATVELLATSFCVGR